MSHGEERGLKSAKTYHVLIEWPLQVFSLCLQFFERKKIIKKAVRKMLAELIIARFAEGLLH